MTPSIRLIASGFDVKPLLAQIAACPSAWNRYRERTEKYAHSQVDDIWCRYNRKVGSPDFHGPHQSRWYPVAAQIPAVIDLCHQVMRHVGLHTLGGVLITRIPPGGEVKPHVDDNWHARHYEKYAIQLMGNQQQGFHFEDSELRAEPGDLYTFDNSKLHWVTNESDTDRMTLIICLR